MTDNNTNNTHAALFELQKNLEDLASAKIQMEEFRKSAQLVVEGIESVKAKYDETIEKIKTDYENKIENLTSDLFAFASTVKDENEQAIKNIQTLKADYEGKISELKNELTAYVSNLKNENAQAMQNAIDKSNESIEYGIRKLDSVSDNIQVNANEKIETLNDVLSQYKLLVADSNTLIDKINEIDFQAKLDSFTAKSQQIIEDITASNIAQQVQLNEAKEKILQETSQSKDKIIQDNVKQTDSLTQKVEEATNLTEAKISKELEKHFELVNIRIDKQTKELRILKILLFIIMAIGVAAFVYFSIQQHVDFTHLFRMIEGGKQL